MEADGVMISKQEAEQLKKMQATALSTKTYPDTIHNGRGNVQMSHWKILCDIADSLLQCGHIWLDRDRPRRALYMYEQGTIW